MILFPYKKVVIEKGIDQMMFLIRLKNITLEENFWSMLSEFSNSNNQYYFVGFVNSSKTIKFRLFGKYGNFYALCNIFKKNQSSQIELIFEVPFYNKMLVVIWSVLIFSSFFIAILEIGFLYLPFLLISILPFAYYWYQFKSGKIEKITNKILEISEGKLCKESSS